MTPSADDSLDPPASRMDAKANYVTNIKTEQPRIKADDLGIAPLSRHAHSLT